MVSRVTVEVVWFPGKPWPAFGLFHSSWIPTDVHALAAPFLLLVPKGSPKDSCSFSLQASKEFCVLSLMPAGTNMVFALCVWQPIVLSVLQGGLQLSVDLRDSLFLTYMCKWLRSEQKRSVCGQRKVGTLGMLVCVWFQMKSCLWENPHTKC